MPGLDRAFFMTSLGLCLTGNYWTLMVRRRFSAVSNHEGHAATARPSSFETREDALLRMRSGGSTPGHSVRKTARSPQNENPAGARRSTRPANPTKRYDAGFQLPDRKNVAGSGGPERR